MGAENSGPQILRHSGPDKILGQSFTDVRGFFSGIGFLVLIQSASSTRGHTMTIDVNELKSRLSTKFLGRSSLLGSQLGAAIREIRPGTNFRDDYGGLKPFVAAFLSDWARPTSKRGLDDVFIIIGTTQDLISLEEQTELLWSAFSNPRYKGMIFVRTTDKKLFYSVGMSKPPESFQLFTRMTKDEYRALACSYLPNLPEEKRTHGERILAAEDFWNEWYNFSARETWKANWESFRVNAIEASFLRALEACAFTSSECERWLVMLRGSRSRTHVDLSHRNDRTSEPKSGPSPISRKVQLSAKHLLSLAVAELGEQEAGNIVVPIRAIVDAIRKQSR